MLLLHAMLVHQLQLLLVTLAIHVQLLATAT
jgi:hypothetical protein